MPFLKKNYKLFHCHILALPLFKFVLNNQYEINMRELFFDRVKTKFGVVTIYWKLILLLLFIFTISCKNKPKIQTIQIKFSKPVHGFKATLYWTPKYIETDDEDEERKIVTGKATLELERIIDKVKYKVNYNLSIDTIVNSDFKKSVYESFVNRNLPRVITIKNNSEKEDTLYYERNQDFFFFKDVNFDDKEEVLLEGSMEMDNIYKFQRVFEFQDNKLVEFQYFPPRVFRYDRNYIGKIDYAKKEISVSQYYSCCEYDENFYRLGSNLENEFVLYKTEKNNFENPIITIYYKE